ncbi:MAG: hypothetical protein NTU49_05095 [Gammaproteobacteria bacterium]|nr:hypothetical protein [Gammaproteobacteria bacterium]
MRNAFILEKPKQKSTPIYPITPDQLTKWAGKQAANVQQWLKTSQFLADSGCFCLVPNADGSLFCIVLGISNADDFLAFGALPAKLPIGNYCIEDTGILKTAMHFQHACLGWGLGFYWQN